MSAHPAPGPGGIVVGPDALQALLSALDAEGFTVIGPTVADGAVVLAPIASLDDLPQGYRDDQDGGRYRLTANGDDAYFAFGPGPHAWKRYLYPPVERLWSAHRRGASFVVDAEPDEPPAYAFFGVRACDLRAIEIQDKVFDNGDFADPRYLGRRRRAFVVAVECVRAGGTCFCASMGTGPAVDAGFDIALTELVDGGRHVFLVRAGTERGAAFVDRLPGAPASEADTDAARTAVDAARDQMRRAMPPDAAEVLARNLNHPHWDAVAERCLTCGNCTMVCPTCFCSTVEDTTDLAGDHAERHRRWDSCFSIDFSYVHGGSVRREGASRYRQWITHKLSAWHEQFGTSGCVGCGRCITWCPVGIDITEEVRSIRHAEGGA